MYINPREHVVVVHWSAHTKLTGGDIVNPEDFLAAVATARRCTNWSSIPHDVTPPLPSP